MKVISKFKNKFWETKGATIVVVAVVLAVLLGFAALAVDVGYLYGVRNELQNGADGGALAGALVLFNADGSINPNADIEAERIAAANNASGQPIPQIVVERGHWSFATHIFTANNSTTQVQLDERTFEELDVDPNFINAVRVTTSDDNAPSFFARILGYQSFFVRTDATAYIGFAGRLDPHDVDQPIAICEDSIQDGNDAYTCNIGRMINSGSNELNNETGGWTNFDQDIATCQSGTNANEMSGLICGEGNPNEIELGIGVGANGGQIQSSFSDFTDCWLANTDIDDDGKGDKPWNITLLVVECPGNNMDNCSKVVGAVNLNIIWINPQNDPGFDDVPRSMTGVPDKADWSCNDLNGENCWSSFVSHYNIQNVDGSPAPYQQKAIYFLPDCTPHVPMGETGGANFGILAKYPYLVQ
ncbi:MAG: pilus assembly protein TadG-related protein [Desulfobulbaceae bacterium]|nr:pilus assembly protein TadG-related protein [Desulfobulbaceae bacterium]